jgi:predicted Zn finger-like uncharacterized protein
MQLACPACHTAFHVDPAALGAGGRTVRCARCRNTWFAKAEDLVPDPAMAGAEAGGAVEVEDNHSFVEPIAPLIQPVVPWNDMVMVEVASSPPLAPDAPAATAVPPVQPKSPVSGRDIVAAGRRAFGSSGARTETRLGFAALILGLIVAIGLTAREPLVRAVPGLAGFYTAIGLPVNLRGLEFHDLRTSYEAQEGMNVLVIEGELVNPTRQTRDIARLRLAVHGADDRELYSWTALLPRDKLLARESLTFRSRLASPPEEGARVSVRFLVRSDLTEPN